MTSNFVKLGLALVATTMLTSAASAEKWDMPMAYAATNYHSEKGVEFADKVREYTDGAIDITVHPGGSLFKGGEIKRAVQTGQAPIGERFMSAHANEAPLLGWDNLPAPKVKSASEKGGYKRRGRKPGRRTEFVNDPEVTAKRKKTLARRTAAE